MKKFTLIALLVIISVIGILITMLLPSLREVRRKSQVAVCISNQSQLMKGMIAYVSYNNNSFPSGSTDFNSNADFSQRTIVNW